MFIPRRSLANSIVSLKSRHSLLPEKKNVNYYNTYKLLPDEKPNIALIEKVIEGTRLPIV